MKSLASVTGALAAGSLAAVLAGCGTGTQAGTSTAPVPLQLTDASTSDRAAMAPGIAGGTGSSSFVLQTTLPTDTPAPAPVWRLPRANATDAATVASALGISGRPTAVAGGWVIRYDGQRLAVRSDGTWSWGMDCSPGVPVDKESLDVMCASASGGGVAVAADAGTTNAGSPAGPVPPPTSPGTPPAPPPSPPAGPTAADARALGTQVLGALGWTNASVDVAVGAPTTTVTARRDINGVETADWTTTLTYRAPATLVDANGWIGEPSRGRSYPLIDAARAFKMLDAEPRMMPELCQVRKDGKPGCEPIPPTVITGASLGLALRHDLERPLLVPAWLFSVKGSTTPLAVVAVDPHWIKPPAVTVPKPLPPQSVNPAGPADDPAGPAVKPS